MAGLVRVKDPVTDLKYGNLVFLKNAALAEPDFDANNPEHQMVRLYIGLEDADSLIKDLERAFEKSGL